MAFSRFGRFVENGKLPGFVDDERIRRHTVHEQDIRTDGGIFPMTVSP